MATWSGQPKKFNMEIYHKPRYEHSSYEDVEYSWEYHTVSDTLLIREVSSNGTEENLMGPDHGKALLYTLAHWYKTYNSREQLLDLLKDIIKEE
jgi:hypothetical protein